MPLRDPILDSGIPFQEVVVKLPRPHPRQAEFIYQNVPRKVVRAGRRGGKTFGIAIFMVMSFLQGKRVLYATPTSDQYHRCWELVRMFLADAISMGVYIKNENHRIISAPGSEARIKLKTAWNADSLRGDFADVLIFDEYQLMHEDAWATVGAPMLLDNGGDAIFIYTPPSATSVINSRARDKMHASKLFKRAKMDTTGRWKTYTFTSHDNPHLDRVALQEITQDMTNLAYRQEILAEELDEVPGALWTRNGLDATRVLTMPETIVRTVIGVDPKVTERQTESETGIIAASLSGDAQVYIHGDYSNNGTPDDWIKKVVLAYYQNQADRVIVEVNQGGALVKSLLRQYDRTIPVHQVRATRGKALRAEPVSALWEQGKAHMVGLDMLQLEDQMVTFVPGSRYSPDRLDAAVWAVTGLMLTMNNVRNVTDKYDWREPQYR